MAVTHLPSASSSSLYHYAASRARRGHLRLSSNICVYARLGPQRTTACPDTLYETGHDARAERRAKALKTAKCRPAGRIVWTAPKLPCAPGANRFRNLANSAALVRHLKGVGRCSDLLADICSAARESAPATTPLGPATAIVSSCAISAIVSLSRAAANRAAEESGRAAVPPGPSAPTGRDEKSPGHAHGFSHRQDESGQRDKRGGARRSRPLGRLQPRLPVYTPHDADGRSVGMRYAAVIGETPQDQENTSLRGEMSRVL